jgi:hypothetical protein
MERDKRLKPTKIYINIVIIFASITMLTLFPAAATTISIGDVTVPLGGTATLPIMITDVTDCGVAAVQFSYDPSVVHVTAVTGSQFDVCDPTIDNVDGDFEIGAVQFWSDGLNGNVRLANVTLQAVGSTGEWSLLNIFINELKIVGPPSCSIPADTESGRIFIEGELPASPFLTKVPTAEPSTWAPMASPSVTTGLPREAVTSTTPTSKPKEPGFEAICAIGGLLALAYVVLRRRP